MNASKYLSAALVAVATVSASGAFAADDGGLPLVDLYVSSTTTRDEVQAELHRAAKAGELPQGEARNYGENQFADNQRSQYASSGAGKVADTVGTSGGNASVVSHK
jgi:hypothetical protein